MTIDTGHAPAPASRAASEPPQGNQAVAGDRATASSSHRRHVVGTVALALTVVALVIFIWPVQRGGHLGITLVTGHSMEPTLHTGDIVLTWKDNSYSPGDIVVYPVPDGPGTGINVVHRLIGFQDDGTLITRGDNNHGPDPWHPTQASVLGGEIATIGVAGNAIDLVRRPWVIALLLAAIAGLCAFWFVLDLTARRED